MTIHHEGRQSILLAAALWSISLAILVIFDASSAVVYSVMGFVSLIFVVILQFFRYPEKNTVINPKHIIAPADGKVVVIEKVIDPEFESVSAPGERLQISIFMSPINVHSNHNPVSGLVKYFKYHPGKYLVAWHPKASTDNERTTVVYELPDKQQLLVRQIAGALARRICWYVKPGMQVTQGEQFGFIKFGSRVDLLLPPDVIVNVKLGDTTTGAETVIATLP